MKINVMISESATKRQLENAKAVFGTKAESILTALEEASKEKILITPGLDALLSALKLSESEFEKLATKSAFIAATDAAKVFATSKNYGSKIAALKAIKFSYVQKTPTQVKRKSSPSKLDTVVPKRSKRREPSPALIAAVQSAVKNKKGFWDIVKALGPVVARHFRAGTNADQIAVAVRSVLGAEEVDKIKKQLIKYHGVLQDTFFKSLKKSRYDWTAGSDDSISDLLYYVTSKGQKAYENCLAELKTNPVAALSSLEKEDYYESFLYAFFE